MNRRQDRNESEVGASDLAFLLGCEGRKDHTKAREDAKGRKEGERREGEKLWGGLVEGCGGRRRWKSDDREEILKATRELLALVIYLNEIKKEDVASAIFTTTPDLVGAFPATAARQLGWLDVPLMCAHEIDVPGSLASLHPGPHPLEHGQIAARDPARLSEGSPGPAPGQDCRAFGRGHGRTQSVDRRTVGELARIAT